MSAVRFDAAVSMPVSAELGESGTVFISSCDGDCDTVLISDSSCDVSVDDTPLEVVD